MTAFVDEHKDQFGVEPICTTLQVAPSTYYAARSRPPSVRECEDARLDREIVRVHEANFRVYGVRKVWKALRRQDILVGRDRVARLMRGLSLEGVVRGKIKRTTRFDVGVSPGAGHLLRGFLAITPAGLPPAGDRALCRAHVDPG